MPPQDWQKLRRYRDSSNAGIGFRRRIDEHAVDPVPNPAHMDEALVKVNILPLQTANLGTPQFGIEGKAQAQHLQHERSCGFKVFVCEGLPFLHFVLRTVYRIDGRPEKPTRPDGTTKDGMHKSIDSLSYPVAALSGGVDDGLNIFGVDGFKLFRADYRRDVYTVLPLILFQRSRLCLLLVGR